MVTKLNQLTLFAISALFLSGCLKEMQFVEFKSGDSAQGVWDSGKGEVRVYLEDGEVLTGKYTKISNARFTIGAGIGRYGRRTGYGVYPSVGVRGTGNFYSLLHSAKTGLVLEIVADYNILSRSGHGEARSNDGRVYKVVF